MTIVRDHAAETVRISEALTDQLVATGTARRADLVLSTAAQDGDRSKLERSEIAAARHARLEHLCFAAAFVQPFDGAIQLALLDLGTVELQEHPLIGDAAQGQGPG